MKRRFACLFLLGVMLLVSLPLHAMSCTKFNSIGHNASSVQELAAHPATKRQVKEFKQVIAEHASKLAAFGGFSERKKALGVVMDKGLISRYLRDSLALTRVKCFQQPAEKMASVAMDEFNYMLDVLAEKL